MTVEQLGERLATALDDVTVAELLDGLPERTDGPSILPAETALAAEPGTPMRWVRELALLSGLIIEVRRLIETSGADVIVGPVGETEGIVARRLAARYPNVTFVLGASGAQAATLSDPQPNLFRFVADGAQSTAGLAAHAYTDLGWRRAALVMDPLPHSWEQAAEFCALGGTVVSRDLLPGGAAADRALAARLSRRVDGTMLISTFSNPGGFLRAYDRETATLPRRLVLTGFAFALPDGLSPLGIDLSGVVLAGEPAAGLEAAAMAPATTGLRPCLPAVAPGIGPRPS